MQNPVSSTRKTSWCARALVAAVKAYRLLLSPHLGQGCRFTPTCSRYFEDAVVQHGAAAGAYLGSLRVLRCGPWCQGGHDPVPLIVHPPFSSQTK